MNDMGQHIAQIVIAIIIADTFTAIIRMVWEGNLRIHPPV